MGFPSACRERYGVPWLVLLVSFIDLYSLVPSGDVLPIDVVTFFLSELHVDAFFAPCPLEAQVDTVQGLL